MIIPDKIDICGHDVTIEKVENVFDTDGSPCIGMAYLMRDTIEIATMLTGTIVSEDNRSMAFLHEVFHHLSDKLDIKFTEKQVTVLSAGLYGVLKNNNLYFGKGGK
jgi:hypothetical protein